MNNFADVIAKVGGAVAAVLTAIGAVRWWERESRLYRRISQLGDLIDRAPRESREPLVELHERATYELYARETFTGAPGDSPRSIAILLGAGTACIVLALSGPANNVRGVSLLIGVGICALGGVGWSRTYERTKNEQFGYLRTQLPERVHRYLRTPLQRRWPTIYGVLLGIFLILSGAMAGFTLSLLFTAQRNGERLLLATLWSFVLAGIVGTIILQVRDGGMPPRNSTSNAADPMDSPGANASDDAASEPDGQAPEVQAPEEN